jgi:hypothetical protein
MSNARSPSFAFRDDQGNVIVLFFRTEALHIFHH